MLFRVSQSVPKMLARAGTAPLDRADGTANAKQANPMVQAALLRDQPFSSMKYETTTSNRLMVDVSAAMASRA